MRHTLVALALVLSLPGCFVFDYGNPPTQGDVDSGTKDSGSTPVATFDDACGADPPATTLRVTTHGIHIDTTTYANDVTSSCGAAPSGGNDVFIGVAAQAGVYWHFHLQNDPTDPAATDHHPSLYMLPTACDARDCTFSSDVCADDGDEHFGFIAPSDGTWYLGIDDDTPGGGRYVLEAIRPTCGDGVAEHGEACDDGAPDGGLPEGGDGCSARCLREVSAGSPSEHEPNDNPTEANALLMPASGELVINGGIGGAGTCRYADTFAVEVPDGAHVEVDVLDDAGMVCADGAALTDIYQLVLKDASFTAITTNQTDPTTGCAQIRSTALAEGVYYVAVVLPAETTTVRNYHLRVRLVAG